MRQPLWNDGVLAAATAFLLAAPVAAKSLDLIWLDEATGHVYVAGNCEGDEVGVYGIELDRFTTLKITSSGESPVRLRMEHSGRPDGMTIIGDPDANPLLLTKDDGLSAEECVPVGGRLTYTLCYDNSGNPFDVHGVVFTDELPLTTSFVSASDGGVYDAMTHTVSWEVGRLEAGAARRCSHLVLRLDGNLLPGELVTNFATVVSDETAPTTVDEVTELCPAVIVPIDVKPASCPNPFGIDPCGALPVTIAGTETFDVTTIDPATVRLAGVAPLRWRLEDVATPYEPYMGRCEATDCTTAGPDGWMDLSFKFDTAEVAAALGDVYLGQVLTPLLSGNLLPELDALPIRGEDVVVIVR